MDPGRRCFVLPCVFGPPPKFQRFTTPWNPRPFVVPVTLTVSPTENTPTLISSPTVSTGISTLEFPFSSRRTLRTTRGAASRPAFLACPSSALFTRRPRGVCSPFAFVRAFFCTPSPPSCTCLIRDVLVTASTELGSASITVHGICCPASLNNCVIPSFLPMIPIMYSLCAESRSQAPLDCERCRRRNSAVNAPCWNCCVTVYGKPFLVTEP